jgi:hypothetical protein
MVTSNDEGDNKEAGWKKERPRFVTRYSLFAILRIDFYRCGRGDGSISRPGLWMRMSFHVWFALLAAVCLAGCKTAPVAPQHTDVYESNIQVLAMPSCTAKMEAFCTCYALFADAEGRKFYIGSPGASEDVEHFIASLKEGESYFLPAAFESFLQEKKSGGRTGRQ